MRKSLKLLLVVITIAVLVGYSMYYYIYTNLTWKLTGLNLSEKDLVTEESKINIPSQTLVDRIKVKLEIKNNSNLPFRLSNFNLKVINQAGTEVGRIQKIRRVLVPANSTYLLDVEVEGINEMALLSDTLSGGLKSYKFVVSGMLGGILPFRYSDNVM